MILDLHLQGLSLCAIARQTGLDRKTVRRYIQRGLEPPAYRPRPPRTGKITAFQAYLRERVAAYPELTASRLHRDLQDLGYGGGYTAVKEALRVIRPGAAPGFEVRFETPPGRQAQVDFAHFRTVLDDEPDVERTVWLFSLVLGHSRQWLDEVANVRVHATTHRVVSEHFAEERPRLQPLPAGPFQAVLRLERRITKDGMVSVAGNLYSVPDTTRRRPVEVHSTADEIRILEAGTVIAVHPVIDGRGQRRITAGHDQDADGLRLLVSAVA